MNTIKKVQTWDIVIALMAIAMSVFAIWEATKFPKNVAEAALNIGPGLYPTLIGSLLIIVSSIIIIRELTGRVKNSGGQSIVSPGNKYSIITLIASIIYCAVLEYLGFIIDTVLLMLFIMYVLKLRNYKKMVLVSIVFAVSLYLVFNSVLGISLPAGLLEDLI